MFVTFLAELHLITEFNNNLFMIHQIKKELKHERE